MPDTHAFLSASSADRWIHCPPSAKLNALIADKGTSYTQEGTEAHLLCEYELKQALGIAMDDPKPTLQYYSQEMQDAADGYRDCVMEKLVEAKKRCSDPCICIEQHLDYSRWVEKGFGTGDCLIISDTLMEVIDFKYGIGNLVDVKMNPQLMCYGLGALDTFGDLYPIETVRLTIYQPRRANISTFDISTKDLLNWAETVLKPAAELAYKGRGEFHCGDWCKFCKIRGTCRQRAKENLEMAKCEFLEPAMLSPNEIGEVLPKIDALVAWADDFKKGALEQALGGASIPNYKIVESRSTRTYTDEDKVAEAVEKEGLDPYEKKLRSVTAMTSYLGKKKFNELLGDYITKSHGKPTLVPESDRRPAMTINTPEEDFKEE